MDKANEKKILLSLFRDFPYLTEVADILITNNLFYQLLDELIKKDQIEFRKILQSTGIVIGDILIIEKCLSKGLIELPVAPKKNG